MYPIVVAQYEYQSGVRLRDCKEADESHISDIACGFSPLVPCTSVLIKACEAMLIFSVMFMEFSFLSFLSWLGLDGVTSGPPLPFGSLLYLLGA